MDDTDLGDIMNNDTWEISSKYSHKLEYCPQNIQKVKLIGVNILVIRALTHISEELEGKLNKK